MQPTVRVRVYVVYSHDKDNPPMRSFLDRVEAERYANRHNAYYVGYTVEKI